MIGNPDFLARVSLDAYLLARCCQSTKDFPDGRTWERAISELVCHPGINHRQYAGQTTLFNRKSLSGCCHELDICATGWAGYLIIECKAKRNGLDKADVAIFDMKILDYYFGNLQESYSEQWWPILISVGGVSNNIRRLCLQKGIILCDPALLPFPVLLRAAAQPAADQYLAETKLHEMIRLGEPVCYPLQKRCRLAPPDEFYFQMYQRQELDDLLWLQEELSSDLLDLYDHYKPGQLEQRSNYLYSRFHVATYG
jgi:hypothetical protein